MDDGLAGDVANGGVLPFVADLENKNVQFKTKI